MVVKTNLGERVNKLSEELNIPKITVESVIKGYLESLVDSAIQGETIVIDNIVSIKIHWDEEADEYYPRGRVSEALKYRLATGGIV